MSEAEEFICVNSRSNGSG